MFYSSQLTNIFVLNLNYFLFYMRNLIQSLLFLLLLFLFNFLQFNLFLLYLFFFFVTLPFLIFVLSSKHFGSVLLENRVELFNKRNSFFIFFCINSSYYFRTTVFLFVLFGDLFVDLDKMA